MASILKGLIEYVGIADSFPTLEDPDAFKQFTVQEDLVIPDAKPDIEQIFRVMAEVVISSTLVIITPEGTSEEGQILTNRKLIVEGFINQKIEYVADEPTQSVHAAHFKVPFSSFIVLPEDTDAITKVIPYIEDIFVQQKDKRKIFKNVTLFLHALI